MDREGAAQRAGADRRGGLSRDPNRTTSRDTSNTSNTSSDDFGNDTSGAIRGLMRCPSTGMVEDPYSAHFHRQPPGRNPVGNRSVGGLQMSPPVFRHRPVMLDEVVELFGPVPAGTVIDATVGGGGHSGAILAAYPHLDILGIDQDPSALAAAADALAPFGDRAHLVRARFDQLGDVVAERRRRAPAAISGVLFDLGVSSPQFDRPERGFSYRADAPLDMRMDPDRARTAADVVNNQSERELTALFAASGEGRFARRIARAIIAARPVTTTFALSDIIRSAIPAPARRSGGHPARRVFQALRIEVNEELDVLPVALDAAVDVLQPGGRCVVLAYHSGEDRIVKERFVEAATGGCVCPPGLPCGCGATPTVRLLNRGARKPSAAEIATNPRSESARLRAVEKLPPAGANETASQ
ncbi:MAG: rRNA (cytosine1402-N4)-methyltransferase [Acidimicrobiaceae bacterium]|nr:rRNA (cytosine1402-N4)-methyltransferase [Acidimicrobiaceae bacterium]